jgi:hypothetical protein
MTSGGGTGIDSSWLQRFLGPLGGMLGVDMEAVSANMASSGESDAIINCAMLAIFISVRNLDQRVCFTFCLLA